MVIPIVVDSSKDLAISVGDAVDFSTPLYKTAKKKDQRIELAKQLEINPKHIFSFIKKSVGDGVSVGEMIAEKKSLFKTKRIFAEIEGIVKEIDHIEGIFLIETQVKDNIQACWFAGEIVSITKRLIEVKIGKHHACATKSITKDFGGEVYFFLPEETIPGSPVGLQMELKPYDCAKLSALNGKGIVTLHEYKEHTDMPKAILKLKSDYDEIVKQKYSYCLAQSEHSTIIFYSL